ncbi:MAG: pentapeptide repeat-containing protein, partial [Anaerolineae bacterium]|nr:pentapeptide repeat-containing protein [Anaerolineae bacterium]
MGEFTRKEIILIINGGDKIRLAGVDMSNENLARLDFEGANLRGAIFQETNLQEGILRGTNMTGV